MEGLIEDFVLCVGFSISSINKFSRLLWGIR